MNDNAGKIAGQNPLELHYFRIPRERWELMLIRACQMGARAIRTVVPWSWHEPRDGVFDLTGATHPARDLAGFIESCGGMGLRLVLQVSPYAGAGLLEGGVPGWLTRAYPEIRALAPDSSPRRDTVLGGYIPSAGHPTYLKYLERWYRELTGALLNRQETAGPISALQINRLGPDVVEPLPGWDYNPHVVKVQWPVWLRGQYDGIDTLNTAWSASHLSFSEVPFPTGPLAPGAPPRPAEDAARFVAYAAAHALETYARLLREMGWTLPIAAEPEAFVADQAPTHISQVDPEPSQLGAGFRWAMDTPLRADGTPRRRFWAVKSAMLGAEEGIKRVEGATLVTGFQERRVRLPRPEGTYGVYRLLLDGQLLEAAARPRGDALSLDYVAEDEDGETDMVLVLDDPSAPLPGFIRDYLVSTLLGRAGALKRGGMMCRAVTEALTETPPAPGQKRTVSSTEDLQAIEVNLEEARRAARQAAVSVGRLERLAGEIRGEIPSAPASTLPGASAFTSAEMERLQPLHDDCAAAGPILLEAGQAIQDQAGGEAFTLQDYRATFTQAREAARGAESLLAGALTRLRVDLASGDLPASAWAFQDWLARILQGLAMG